MVLFPITNMLPNKNLPTEMSTKIDKVQLVENNLRSTFTCVRKFIQLLPNSVK